MGRCLRPPYFTYYLQFFFPGKNVFLLGKTFCLGHLSAPFCGSVDDTATADGPFRLTIDPKWCYGKQGPLYLVACAVNGSVYRHKAGKIRRRLSFLGFGAVAIGDPQVVPSPWNSLLPGLFLGHVSSARALRVSQQGRRLRHLHSMMLGSNRGMSIWSACCWPQLEESDVAMYNASICFRFSHV